MTRELTPQPQSRIFYLLWSLIHITYQLKSSISDYLRFSYNHVKARLLSRREFQLANFVESVSKLPRVPKHLAISVMPECNAVPVLLQNLWFFRNLNSSSQTPYEKDGLEAEIEVVELNKLASVIAWASAANISVISLYDYHGILKRRYKELGSLITDDISRNFEAAKQEVDKPPFVKFHNVEKSDGNGNGVEELKPQQGELHIFVYSREDGKPAIVNVAKDIYSENLNIPKIGKVVPSSVSGKQSLTTPHFNEGTLDQHLNRRHKHVKSKQGDLQTDPDLLIILGKVKSTLGFLPWHIRLTEIHWLPHLGKVTLSDIFESLYKYSKCQKRFGA